MNLLKTDTLEIVHIERPRSTPPYAILSHRWESHELTFRDMTTLRPALLKPSSTTIPSSLRISAAKILSACAMARQQRLGYIWIDTCCIEKDKSEDLRYALNMMFKWYRDAAVCYTYFNDIVFDRPSEAMFMSDRPDRRGKSSEWFERGWTLQELLAPRKMQFFDKRWKYMGTRNELATTVGRVAGISPDYLNGKRTFDQASCATRMSWMAGRVTQKAEDIAYSLIGLFDVYLEPKYGEGTRAFVRLQDAIMNAFGRFDESLFAWKRPQDSILRCYRDQPGARHFEQSEWGLLAPSPDCFKDTGNVIVRKDLVEQRPDGGFGKSHQGIFFSLPSNEVNHRLGRPRNELSLPLNCWRIGSSGALETIVLKLAKAADGEIFRIQCDQLSSQRGAKPSKKKGLIIAVAQPYLGQRRL